MLTSTLLHRGLIILASITGGALASSGSDGSLAAAHRRSLARRASNPSNLAKGSLTRSEGCTAFYSVKGGDTCSGVSGKYHISLAQFYKMNPEIDSRCSNLWTGTSYCVSRTATSTKSKSGAKHTTTAHKSTATSSSKSIAVTVGDLSGLKELGINQFLGVNGQGEDAIGSWFHTYSGQDSTNGHSWCGYPYSDNIPGFAPSLGRMMKNFNYDYNTAATKFCGLEAELVLADGKKKLIYISDAFDDRWVRTPSSIDIIYDTFMELYGSETSNKDIVFKSIEWRLTGRRDERLKFKGVGAAGF